MRRLLFVVANIQQPTHQTQCDRCKTSHVEGYAKMQKTSQSSVSVVECSSTLPPFFIEIVRSIYEELEHICLVERIPMKILVQRLLMHMLVYHKNEVNDIIRLMKIPEGW